MEDDPTSRIFVGNLSADVDQVELRNRFKPYGIITSVNVLKGFGFVQFSKEEDAKEAIQKENGTTFMGNNIDVKPAKVNKKKEPEVIQIDEPKPKQHKPEWSNSSRGGPPPFRGRGRGRGRRPYDRHDGGREREYRDRGYPDKDYHPRGGYGGDRYHDHRPPFHDKPEPPPPKKEKPCDCEIVCVNKNQRSYAETLEKRLNVLGMDVDILFPNPEIPLTKILDNISSRGVQYAILVTPLHAEMRSVTINILQGQTQEHRNMPIEDAVNLLAKHFERIIDGREDSGKHPEDIQSVLGFLIENRPLSVMEYDKLLKYLSTKRRRMLKREYGDNIPPHLVKPPVDPPADPAKKAKEDEVKTRIAAFLNKPREAPVTSFPSASAAAPVAIDPNLQKAIDSLIQSGPNLLQNLTSQSTSKAPETQYGGYNFPSERGDISSQLYSSYGSGGGY